MTRTSKALPQSCTITSPPRARAVLTEFSDIEGAYLRDILDQPKALEDTLTGLNNPKTLGRIAAKLQKSGFRAVVLTGMGSSFHALHPSNLELINHGFITMMVETSE